MYAQLCKRLIKEAPNFENPSDPCTFRILLLSKCRDEFENRSKASAAFDEQAGDGPLTPEEEERRQNAKRKMLGNIKFIGELGKLEILGESILHRCIQQLLQDKKKREREMGRDKSASDMTEDLELLCQIMKTCGRNLDHKGKNLMDQYFQRMSLHANNPEISVRIRFMLRDVIELRMGGWVPRQAARVDGPVPMHQIQVQNSGPARSYHPPIGQTAKNQFSGNAFDKRPVGSSYNTFNSSRPSNNNSQDRFGFDFTQRPVQHHNFNTGSKGNNQQQNFPQSYSKQNYNNNNFMKQDINNSGPKKEFPPRFKEKSISPLLSAQQSQINLEDLSLRPPPHSMHFKHANTKPNNPGLLGQGRSLGSVESRPLVMSQPLNPEPPVLVKQPSLDKNKTVKKEKISSKDAVMKKIETLMEQYLKQKTLQETEQLPDKVARPLLLAVMTNALDKQEADRENASGLIGQLKKQALITSAQFLDSYRNLLSQIADKEQEIPRINSFVAAYAAHAISRDVTSLAKISDVTENGAHYPLFLLILQQLHKLLDKSKLLQLFNESKVNLLKQLPEIDRNKERLFQILEDRDLGFLFPLLRIQSELWNQLQKDPNPGAFYKWIKENVEADHHGSPEFVNALVTVVLKYITLECTPAGEVDKQAVPDKSIQEKERALLSKFKAVLQAFLHERIDLQVTALYALQAFCHSMKFPKGMILRWFVSLYDLEVLEEDAFFKWKEDVSDIYPGKGETLFQVNSWLTWLEQAESEPEEED